MTAKISEHTKTDVAIAPQSLASAATTSDWFSMDGFHDAAFHFSASSMASSKTVKVQLSEARSSTGLGAQVITASTAAIVASIGVAESRVEFTSKVVDGHNITINTLTFTGTTTSLTNTLASRTFSVRLAGTTRSAYAATQFTSLINNPTFGVPGVTATAGTTGNLILTATTAGSIAITAASTAGSTGITVWASRSQAIAETSVNKMTMNTGYKYLKAVLTTDATIVAGMTLIRSRAAKEPVTLAVADISTAAS